MNKFEIALKNLDDSKKKFLEDLNISEDELYSLGRSMYMISYNSKEYVQGDTKLLVKYEQEDTEQFLKEFKKSIEDLSIDDSKKDVEKLFDIICDIYVSTAKFEEKKGSRVRTKRGFGITDIFITEDLNEIPSEYLIQIKETLLK